MYAVAETESMSVLVAETEETLDVANDPKDVALMLAIETENSPELVNGLRDEVLMLVEPET